MIWGEKSDQIKSHPGWQDGSRILLFRAVGKTRAWYVLLVKRVFLVKIGGTRV
jgi:hypothetical protein